MTKEDILEYVSRTPHNTNPNMIGNMIDALTAQSGGGLPDPSEASVGDVLTKGEEGLEWAPPSGGDERYLHQIFITIDLSAGPNSYTSCGYIIMVQNSNIAFTTTTLNNFIRTLDYGHRYPIIGAWFVAANDKMYMADSVYYDSSQSKVMVKYANASIYGTITVTQDTVISV